MDFVTWDLNSNVQYRRRMKDGAWNKKNDKNRALVLLGHILRMQLIAVILTVQQACGLES